MAGSLSSHALVPGSVNMYRPTTLRGGVANGVDVQASAKGRDLQLFTGCLTSGAVALVVAAKLRRIRRVRHGCQRNVLLAAKKSDDDDTLMKAGLRSLLGATENKMAQQLQKACEVSEDRRRCLDDSELSYKLAMEELAKTRGESANLEQERNKLLEQLDKAVRDTEEKDNAAATAVAEAQSEAKKIMTEKQMAEEKAAAAEEKAAALNSDLAAAREELVATKEAVAATAAELASVKEAAAASAAEVADAKKAASAAEEAAVALKAKLEAAEAQAAESYAAIKDLKALSETSAEP
eukprot:CAMPEP_0172784158 /NCGR_PEP_ID=MMETSP1074-20121228/204802_1 /TAXON_ID=2916 /ORGANISM="Ceratium fusus, Strain PA161109" /LENGTH=294 /DNA_ID=CAMNT_0013621159 /DNA_START=75 /DNA_END=959 /DNA_ORIENTATION=+